MRIEGRFTAPGPTERVWALIRDPAVMAPLVPGCRDVTTLEDGRYKAEVAVSVGPISAKFNLDITIVDEEPPLRVRTVTRGEEGSRASAVMAESTLTLESADDGETAVIYASEVTVTGRLAKFGLGVMKKKAEAIGRAFADNFSARVAEEMAVSGDPDKVI